MDSFGGIEAGGTKFVCVVGTGPNDIRTEVRFPTLAPEETLAQAVSFFEEQRQYVSLKSIGIGSFGPVDLNPLSETYGFITTTPKPGWQMVDIRGSLQRALDLPVTLDTDVNTAALGESTWGAGKGYSDFIYLTIGTGIGGGGFCSGRLIHGLTHPEMGHLLLPHDRKADPFPGSCPFHGDCFEGLASGPAIQKRWEVGGQDLPPDHPAWELEAGYIAMALTSYIYTLSPQRIILGGGVMQQAALFPLIRQKVRDLLNGYIQTPRILEELDDFIVPPALGVRSGVLGAIALAQDLS